MGDCCFAPEIVLYSDGGPRGVPLDPPYISGLMGERLEYRDCHPCRKTGCHTAWLRRLRCVCVGRKYVRRHTAALTATLCGTLFYRRRVNSRQSAARWIASPVFSTSLPAPSIVLQPWAISTSASKASPAQIVRLRMIQSPCGRDARRLPDGWPSFWDCMTSPRCISGQP